MVLVDPLYMLLTTRGIDEGKAEYGRLKDIYVPPSSHDPTASIMLYAGYVSGQIT